MKKKKTLISIFIFIIFSIQIFSQTENSETTDQKELEIILKKCAEYCEKLEKVLYFICKEEIKEVVNSPISLKQALLDFPR